MEEFAKMLAGGDRRSIGKADAVVAIVRAAPERFEELWACLRQDDGLVRLRAADAIEKLTRADPALLGRHKKELLGGGLDDGTKEVAWHLVALTSRLMLTPAEARAVVADLKRRLAGASAIVAVMALQAAADIGARHPALQKDYFNMLDYAKTAPAAALRARARKLAAKLERT